MRTPAAPLLLGLSLALTACGPINRGLESVNQPVVSQTNYATDVSAAGLTGPSSGEAQRLADWFDSPELGYGDRVAIDDSAAYAGGSREVIAAVVARYGLLLSDGAPVTTGAIAPGAVRVVVSRSVASVPGCPNWSLPSQPDLHNSTMSNFGCATNRNLAAMIANPQDLVRGARSSGIDARVTSKAIKSYRDKVPTGEQDLEKVDTKGGK
jgi:pilus assembly protein CpaD